MRIGKTRLAALAGILALSVLPAFGANVRNCDDFASNAQSLAEPWEKNTRSFLNGSVRIALMDTGGEPVCCSTHLLVLAEDRSDEHGGRACHLVSNTGNMGYEWIDFPKITASYSPARGLLLTVPIKVYVDGIKDKRGLVRVMVDTQRGAVTAK